MKYELPPELSVSAEGAIRVVTISRPDELNAVNQPLHWALANVWRQLAADLEAKVVIITGAGRAFSAGGDLDWITAFLDDPAARDESLREGAQIIEEILRFPLPVIAAVNGPAAGGGMSLTLMADIRLGSPAAKFNAAFVRIGLSAGDLGASWLLPRLIGPSAAAEIGFTGRIVEADEAERLGLLNRVTSPDDLLDQTLEMAAQICANSPGGIRMSKRALQANMEVASFAAALELENRGQALLTRCDDMTEALQAFKAKRAPKFSGR
jgi:enoyl-CoA hydratase/carnithine racemase